MSSGPLPTPDSNALGRKAREVFISQAEGVMEPMAEAVRARLIELVDQSASTKEMQDRRDAMLEFERLHKAWTEGTPKAWRRALVPPTSTARVRLEAVSLELIGDDVVEKKILSSRLALSVLDKVTSDGADSLLNIETIQFRDLTMDATAISKTASLPLAQVMKIVDLYTAGLDRAPDALGLIYWAGKLADGVSLSQISKAFFNGPELGEIYSFKTADLVSIIYNDALGRAADAEGAAYWVNQIDSGKLARTDLVSALVAAAKATGGEADATFIAAEEAVGGHFALTQGQNNGDWAKKVLADVNGSVESVAAANALTDAYAAQAAAPGSSELVVQILGLVP